MRALLIVVLLTAVVGAAPPPSLSTAETKRVQEAAQVLKEIHAVPDKDIPQELWSKAACVIVVPGLKKAAFVFGGEYGKGLMSCRHSGTWSAPVFMHVGKGSWGLQIGAQSIDLVLLVMNEGGMQKMLKNKVSLGAEASIAGGPVGRDARAATDVQMKAEILSYSRTQGLFAGVNLSGGQRQRTALARALATEARVVVLDDPLSAVDTLTERRLVKRLRPALESRTVLVATQRLSTVELADRAVVLVDGRIVESGTPRELLRAGGLFAELFSDEVVAA
jgi:lipid-binding SYLF domain-containing protein